MDELDIKEFTDDQKKVLVDYIEKKAEAKAKEVLEKHAINADDLALSDVEKFYKKDEQRLAKISDIWKNNGKIASSRSRVSMRSLIDKDIELTLKAREDLRKLPGLNRDNFSTDHPLLIPRVLSNMAREAIEPAQVLTPLLPRVTMEKGTRIVFPSWGAMHAADIPEGGEYPERSLDLAGNVTATTGKVGIAIKITEEMKNLSQFDVLSMHVRAAGNALARYKEIKVANMLLNNGTTLIDNGDSNYKNSTGRNGAGAYNATLTLDDLFYAFAQMVNSGFTPNTLIMHPFAWQIFSQEPIARAFGFINGMNPLMWQTPKGMAGSVEAWRAGGLNQNTYTSSPGNIATTFTNVPSIFPTNFKIVVSPWMTYDATNKLTTVILCDSNELGVMLVEEDVMTDQWDDPARDITKIKFRERYGVAAINNGLAIGLLKNIKIATSYDFRNNVSLQLTGITDGLSGDDSTMTALV